MSKRSAFKTHQRVREGIEGKRRVQLHVMETQTQRIANLVAARLKDLVNQLVDDVLDQRGYTQTKLGRPHDVEDLYTDGGREDSGPPTEVSQEPDGRPDSEAPGVVEKERCPGCGEKFSVESIVFLKDKNCWGCKCGWNG